MHGASSFSSCLITIAELQRNLHTCIYIYAQYFISLMSFQKCTNLKEASKSWSWNCLVIESVYLRKMISISFLTEWNMIVMTIFLPFLI